MRLSRRSLRIGLALFGVVVMIGALVAVFAPSGLLSHASPKAVTASYGGTAGSIKRLAASASAPANPNATPSRPKYPKALVQMKVPSTKASAANAVRGTAPHLNNGLTVAQGTLLHNFNGLSDLDQANANGGAGFELTPPDQGLCAGNEPFVTGHPRVVWEPINSAVVEYSLSGKVLLGPFSFAQFFEPSAFSDPRCFYDTTTNTFFFTVIGSNNSGSVNDVAVYNANGFPVYQFSTSNGGTCFGDQPKAGYDAHAFYMATDQFCNTGYLG
jgi:hypothetical protein